MQTVILAAGEGTRMRPLTDSLPKPMLPVADRPLVAHVADAAVAAGASELIIVVGYRGAAIREHFGDDRDGIPIRYVDQPEQRGTADAVRAARDALDDGPFVVLNGDVILDASVLGDLYDESPAVGATRVADPRNYGVFELDEDAEHVRRVVEKPADPPSTLVNAGAYAFPPLARTLLDDVSTSERGEFELTDVLNGVCETHDLRPILFERWLDVGHPWELLAANEWKLGEIEAGQAGSVDPDTVIEGAVRIEPGATVHAGVTIRGPALIRSGASIGPNAFIRGATLVGEDATVGHAVEVKNSVLFAGATVGHLAYVGDSLLGRDVNFGAGTTVANLRHDGEPIRTIVRGQDVSTDRRKFGVVVGESVKTGVNTSLNAGLVLGSQETTLPGEVVLESRP